MLTKASFSLGNQNRDTQLDEDLQ